MIRPLYPLRPKAPIPKEKELPPWWKSPHLIAVAVILIVVASLFTFQRKSRNGVLDPEALPGAQRQEAGGILSFINRSKYFQKSATDISAQNQGQLSRLGLSTDSQALSQPIKAANLREQRRILAIQKHEAAHESARRRQRDREELMTKLSTPTSMQLKEAVKGLENSDTLGIMRLERLLEERLLREGGDSRDLDVLIYAYDVLANTYVERGMPERAKEAYVNAFRLMKNRAPEEQIPGWDKAITTVEQMKTPARSN